MHIADKNLYHTCTACVSTSLTSSGGLTSLFKKVELCSSPVLVVALCEAMWQELELNSKSHFCCAATSIYSQKSAGI